MNEKIRITVVGSGYVGMSLSVLLAQHSDVKLLDVDPLRVSMVNKNQSTIKDTDIESFLSTKQLNLTATLDKKEAYRDASFIIVATPTDYDPDTYYFDTSSVDTVVADYHLVGTCLHEKTFRFV